MSCHLGGIAALGPDGIVEKLNNSFAIVVIASFFSLVLLGISGLHPQYLLHQNIYAVLHTIPVMFVALVYHNIVPSICSQLSYHKQSIKKVLFVGTIIPTLMFVVWNAVILGSIDSSLYTSMKIDPLDILRTNSQSGFIGPMISLFSMAAIVTSFIGFIYGLMEFFADVFTGKSKKDASLAGLVLLPPMVIAMADPNIFMNALDYAGTYGISMLFGVLPISLAFVLR